MFKKRSGKLRQTEAKSSGRLLIIEIQVTADLESIYRISVEHSMKNSILQFIWTNNFICNLLYCIYVVQTVSFRLARGTLHFCYVRWYPTSLLIAEAQRFRFCTRFSASRMGWKFRWRQGGWPATIGSFPIAFLMMQLSFAEFITGSRQSIRGPSRMFLLPS